MSNVPPQIRLARLTDARGRRTIEATLEHDLVLPAGSRIRWLPVGATLVAGSLVFDLPAAAVAASSSARPSKAPAGDSHSAPVVGASSACGDMASPSGSSSPPSSIRTGSLADGLTL